LLCSLDKIPLRNRFAELQSDEDACPRGLCDTCHEELPPGLWPRLQECYPRTKEKKKRCLGEPRRRPQVGVWKEKTKSCLGEPCRHPQVEEKVGEPCKHPQGKDTKKEYPKKKSLELMSLDKMSQPSQKSCGSERHRGKQEDKVRR
jgi:hypothetical protein